MERYICIHGHFYQPPRANPWLEDIELQNSAYPYHDWNEKITAECYAPNSVSRILDGEGRITGLRIDHIDGLYDPQDYLERLRLHVLSEMPEEWETCCKLWRGWNQTHKKEVNNLSVPDASQEVLIYQTMLGAWPLNQEEIPEFKERLKSYTIKAAREAKVHTRWISANPEHEQALENFVAAILQESDNNAFLQDFLKLQAQLAFWGALNSLSLVLLKIASPGVPDFYQGTELWDLSLVDPDNRRPVDFHQRAQLLNDLKKKEKQGAPALIQELLAHWQTGDIKLFITWKALNFRRNNLNLFLQGDYLPLAAQGAQEQHLVAFARRHDSMRALAVAGRFFSKLSPPGQFPVGEGVWGETSLALSPEAPREWHNLFKDEIVATFSASKSKALPLKQVFRDLPVALLYGRSV